MVCVWTGAALLVLNTARRTASAIGRDNANNEGNEPLYRVYKVGPVKLYTVESILRLLLHFIGSGSADLEGIQRNVWRPISSHSDSEG